MSLWATLGVGGGEPRTLQNAPVVTSARSRRWRWLLALLLVEGLAVLLDLAWGPHGAVHWEEQVNARNGALMACGHLEDWAALQYRTFCGGCTVEGLLAAPLFRGFGATVAAWKAVPAAFHLGSVLSTTALAGRLRGPGCALAAALLLVAAPGFYRELALTGWGNHAESSLFPLLAALLLLGRPGHPTRLGAGLLVGLGIWFAPISAHALPVLAWLAARVRRGWATFGVGLAVGLLPIRAFLSARPAGARESTALWTGFDLAPLSDWLGFLGARGIGGGLWSPFEYGDLEVFGTTWWLGLWLLGGLGAWRQLRQPGPGRGLIAGALAALVLAYALRHDLWAHLPEFPNHPAFNLRYLAPLVPWLALGGAVAVAAPRGLVSRRAAWLVLALGACSGLGLRVLSWGAEDVAPLDRSIVVHARHLDRTVPLGDPPQANRRLQGRPQDLEAAVAWIDGHRDPLPGCRRIHLVEAGRRLGLADQPLEWAKALVALAPGGAERRVLAVGIARPLLGVSPEHLAARLRGFGVFGTEVGVAWGRLAAPAWRGVSVNHMVGALPPSAVAGICHARGRHEGAGRAGLRPGWHLEDPGAALGCERRPSYQAGLRDGREAAGPP